MSTTQQARTALGLNGGGQQEDADTPLAKARAAHQVEQRKVNELEEQQYALQRKRDQIAGVLAREGKLTREQRSELSRVNREIKALATPLKRAEAKAAQALTRLNREQQKVAERNERERQKRVAREDAAKARARAVNRRKLDRRVAAVEAKLLKSAGAFARLPQGAKPSRATAKDATSPIAYGYVTKEGRGKSARWVLVVTDSYGMAVLPLDVTGKLPVDGKGAFIPPEALKAIDKTGAFRITKNGGIQPVTVTESSGSLMYEPSRNTPAGTYQATRDPAEVWAAPRRFEVEAVGTAYMLPEQAPGRFVDHTQHVPKQAPAKVNALEWAVDPQLLKQVAEALGAGSGSVGNVVVTFDLSKTGKASEGRRVSKPVTVQRYDRNAARPAEGPTAVLMPVRLAERKK